MRTFLPEIELNSATDGRVHKSLSLSSVSSGDLGAVQRRLGEAARSSTLFADLPDWFSAIANQLVTLEVELLAEGLRSNSASVEATALEQALSRTITIDQPQPDFVADTEDTQNSSPTGVSANHHALATDIQAVVIEQLEEQLRDATERLEELSRKLDLQTRAFAAAEQAKSELVKTLTAESGKTASIQAELDQARRERNDLEWEAADAYDTVRMCQAIDRMRRGQLIKHGLLAEAEVESVDPTPTVDSFADLAEMLAQNKIDGIEFTGDLDELTQLDSGTLGVRATQVWDILQVLKDFVDLRKQGFAGDLKRYLDDDSHFGMKVPVSTLKRGESASTDHHRRRRESRMCRVPITVDPSGQIYMDAHLSFGRRGRMHFHDDSGSLLLPRIYIGYIGYHLETTKS